MLNINISILYLINMKIYGINLTISSKFKNVLTETSALNQDD